MNITIIIDKSTFQSLNYNEIMLLSRYFKHNITPVLTMEILGDLKKDFNESKKPSEERVIDFANKLFPVNTVVNMHYQHLVLSDLSGNYVPLSCRPMLEIEKNLQSESGQKGWLIKETAQEKAIQKWKSGNFSEADYDLSNLWRVNTTEENLLNNLKRSLKIESKLEFANFSELNQFINETIVSPKIQYLLLAFVLENYNVDAETGVRIFSRWGQMGQPLIKVFSPYAYHCLFVDSLFLFGLASGLISTRPTNRVDMEYNVPRC